MMKIMSVQTPRQDCLPKNVGPRAASLLFSLLARATSSPDGGWVHAYGLASEVGVPYRGAWGLLKALEANGLAESRRTASPGTKRERVEYRLTPEGIAYASDALAHYHRREARKRARSLRLRRKPAAAKGQGPADVAKPLGDPIAEPA